MLLVLLLIGVVSAEMCPNNGFIMSKGEYISRAYSTLDKSFLKVDIISFNKYEVFVTNAPNINNTSIVEINKPLCMPCCKYLNNHVVTSDIMYLNIKCLENTCNIVDNTLPSQGRSNIYVEVFTGIVAIIVTGIMIFSVIRFILWCSNE